MWMVVPGRRAPSPVSVVPSGPLASGIITGQSWEKWPVDPKIFTLQDCGVFDGRDPDHETASRLPRVHS